MTRRFCLSQRARCIEDLSHRWRSEEHTSELQSRFDLVCRLLLEKKKYTFQMQSARVALLLAGFAMASTHGFQADKTRPGAVPTCCGSPRCLTLPPATCRSGSAS